MIVLIIVGVLIVQGQSSNSWSFLHAFLTINAQFAGGQKNFWEGGRNWVRGYIHLNFCKFLNYFISHSLIFFFSRFQIWYGQGHSLIVVQCPSSCYYQYQSCSMWELFIGTYLVIACTKVQIWNTQHYVQGPIASYIRRLGDQYVYMYIIMQTDRQQYM